MIGVAAREGTAIRITHGTSEYAYVRIMRERAERDGLAGLIATDIPLPGLSAPGSQIAVPLRVGGCTVGVLFVESPLDARFSWEDEDALVAIAAQLGMVIVVLQQAAEASDELPAAAQPPSPPRGAPIVIRHYGTDHSVFIGDDYLIKGVAGAIFRKLVRDYLGQGRTDFSNRELRLDPSIRLPADPAGAPAAGARRRDPHRKDRPRALPSGGGAAALADRSRLTGGATAGPAPPRFAAGQLQLRVVAH